ncbi:MAG: hypothetical protein K7J46_08970 [Bryobacter sp.]|jgi:hypothetical protein|nr:hypothetical protein [Bryobacter sp. CoA8 C33]
MEESRGSVLAPASPRIERTLAALQAATLSFLLTTFWFGISTSANSHSFWTLPNLMSGVFYGPASLRPDFGFHTLSGLALHVLLSCLFAVLYALAVPATLPPLSGLLIGILSASWWFYVLDAFFWRPLFPAMSVYSRRPSIFFSFVLMGICIGLYSVFVRSPKETKLSA